MVKTSKAKWQDKAKESSVESSKPSTSNGEMVRSTDHGAKTIGSGTRTANFRVVSQLTLQSAS